MLRRWVEWLRSEAPPRGYRPGVTLQRLLRELPASSQPAGGAAVVCTIDDGLAFLVRERTESLFLSHTVACEFCLPLSLPLLAANVGRIVIRHTGAIRRQRVICLVQGPDDGTLATIASRLQDDAALQTALLPLDFRRCELRYEADGWLLCIEHFAASEVISLMPPLRRYIRLIPSQRQALLQSLHAFRQLLAQ